MIDRFEGRTAVLTGAGSGFGLECARIAAQRGMNVVLVDIRPDALEQARAEAERAGVQVLARVVDVSKADQMEALCACATPDDLAQAQTRFIERMRDDYAEESKALGALLTPPTRPRARRGNGEHAEA